jgi:hypothetical protein
MFVNFPAFEIEITLPCLKRPSLESIISHIIQDLRSEVLHTQDGEEADSFKRQCLYANLHDTELQNT